MISENPCRRIPPGSWIPLLPAVLALTALTPPCLAETIDSPNGQIHVVVSPGEGSLSLAISRGQDIVAEASMTPLREPGESPGRLVIEKSEGDSVSTVFPSRHGVHAMATDRHNSRMLAIHAPVSDERFVLDLRVFDDGVAFRCRFPDAANVPGEADRTVIAFPQKSRIWHQPGTSTYKGSYREDALEDLAKGTQMGPPVVAVLPGSRPRYAAITQSGSGSFGNPHLEKDGERGLKIVYPEAPYGPAAGPAETPWHVVVVADSLDDLVNADIVEALAPPPDPSLFPPGTAWNTNGRSVWDWMSRFPGGITPQNARLNNLWAAELGFEYNTVDEGWNSWNGGNCWELLREVAAHARSLDVKVIVWARSEDLRTSEARAEFFSRLKTAGVSGLKANFFDFGERSAAAADRLALVEDLLAEAATYELVVSLHGCSKPVGQFRTYPNLLNCAAVMERESAPVSGQEVCLPFTRLLAGPADFPLVSFAKPHRGNRRNTTAAYEIAMVAALAAPMITFAERSDTMAASPFAPVLRKIPTTWDETIVLPQSEIGRAVLMARRSGRTWFVAGANGGDPVTWSIPLKFLAPDTLYQAEIVRDGSDAVEHQLVDRETVLAAAAAMGGGFVARITPPDPPVTALPFATSFNPGAGERYFIDGIAVGQTPWVESAAADRPPTWRWRLEGPGSEGLRVSTDAGDAFLGGASLRVSGTLQESAELRLFAAKLPVDAGTRMRIVSKRGEPHVPSGLQVVVRFEDGEPGVFDVDPALTSGWATTEFSLGDHAGRTIREIGLRFGSAATTGEYTIQIGAIILHRGTISRPGAPESLRVATREELDADSLRMRLEWDPSPGPVRHYNVYARWADGARTWLGASAAPSIAVRSLRRRDKEKSVELDVEAVAPDFGRSSVCSTRVDFPPLPDLAHLLTGTVIGTDGSWGGNANTRERAFDGNMDSYFDAPIATGAWVGLDFGASGRQAITGIRYCPRKGWADRMVGGVFQGANNADFSDAVHLGTVSAPPEEGVFSTLAVTVPNRFRHVRYLSPADGWSDVAELEFYGQPPEMAWPSALAVGGGNRVSFQAVQTSSTSRPEEVNEVIDGKDAGGVGWTVRTDTDEVQSLVVKTAQPVRAQSFDLVLCFLSGRPGCYPGKFALSFTTDPRPSLGSKWQRILPDRFTTMGPELRAEKDGLLVSRPHDITLSDAIFQVWMKAPVQPVTGFRIDIFPTAESREGRAAAAWQGGGEISLTEFRVNSNESLTTNIAAGRPVRTSHSLWTGMSPGMLTDGLPGSYVHPADPGVGPAFFFEIDLGLVQDIDHIALRNRADGIGADRMSRLRVALFDREPEEGVDPVWTAMARADGSHPEPGGIEILRATDGTGNCRGRYLRISGDSPVSFSPQLAEIEVYGVLPVRIAAVEADGEEIPPDGPIEIPAGTRLLTFEFDIPGANLPDHLPIRWRLEGLHDDWQTSRGASAQVMNPPSGSYVLEVQVGHTDGEWDAFRLVQPLEVSRHFWQRPDFLLPLTAAGVGMILLAGRRAQRQREARKQAQRQHKIALAEERTRIARDMHDEVGARLSQIAMMQDLVIRRHTLPDTAREALRELSSNTRRAVDALDQAVWAVNPTHDSLSGVVEYLSNTATSYLSPLGISCHLDVPLQWPQIEVRAQVRHQLVLAFQEALQNIAKHSGSTTAALAIRYDAKCLEVRLSDSGSGSSAPATGPGHDGIANMRSRLESIGGQFSIHRAEAGGMEVTLRVPV